MDPILSISLGVIAFSSFAFVLLYAINSVKR